MITNKPQKESSSKMLALHELSDDLQTDNRIVLRRNGVYLIKLYTILLTDRNMEKRPIERINEYLINVSAEG